MSHRFQPYEAHIPYMLQFLCDYNLYGMDFVRVSHVTFRHPMPDKIHGRVEVEYEGENGGVQVHAC